MKLFFFHYTKSIILIITTVQSSLLWEDIPNNLRHFANKLSNLNGKTDIVILPEMFTTGFTMHPESVAEAFKESLTIDWMTKMSLQINAAICGSVIIEEDGNYFNRLLWVTPDGVVKYYDKRHLFTLAGEHIPFTAGKKKLIVEYKGWKICPLVCYDLRFPVWCRNVENYDLLIFVANWPEKRRHHWQSLLMARAIENQCYLVGVNRVGKDENDLVYSGDTSIIDYAGEILYQKSDEEDVNTIELSKEKLTTFKKKLNFLADRDSFNIK